MWPPPQRTAYFCASRSPGTVLRVSRMRQLVPATACAWRRVVVAVPDSVCRKFSAQRSPVRMARAGPRNSHSVAPAATRSPSRARQSTLTRGSICRKVSASQAEPQRIISSRVISVARAWVSAGMSAVVTSPGPMSSASARATSSDKPGGRAPPAAALFRTAGRVTGRPCRPAWEWTARSWCAKPASRPCGTWPFPHPWRPRCPGPSSGWARSAPRH